MNFCTVKDEKIVVRVYVQPNASRSQIDGIHGDALKIRLKAPPVEGKANDELIAFFAKLLKVAKKQVVIRHGQQSRSKIIEVTGVSAESINKFIGQFKTK